MSLLASCQSHKLEDFSLSDIHDYLFSQNESKWTVVSLVIVIILGICFSLVPCFPLNLIESSLLYNGPSYTLLTCLWLRRPKLISNQYLICWGTDGKVIKYSWYKQLTSFPSSRLPLHTGEYSRTTTMWCSPKYHIIWLLKISLGHISILSFRLLSWLELCIAASSVPR